MYCRNCGKELDAQAAACTQCGVAPMTGKKFCHNCGKETNEAAVVCVSCGVALGPAKGVAVAGAEKKMPAGICGILLGALGIHKFILGYNMEGVIMLLVSIIGGIFTCGIASTAVWIIGLVEGIIYLTKSDEDFVKTYVENKKGWF